MQEDMMRTCLLEVQKGRESERNAMRPTICDNDSGSRPNSVSLVNNAINYRMQHDAGLL